MAAPVGGSGSGFVGIAATVTGALDVWLAVEELPPPGVGGAVIGPEYSAQPQAAS